LVVTALAGDGIPSNVAGVVMDLRQWIVHSKAVCCCEEWEMQKERWGEIYRYVLKLVLIFLKENVTNDWHVLYLVHGMLHQYATTMERPTIHGRLQRRGIDSSWTTRMNHGWSLMI